MRSWCLRISLGSNRSHPSAPTVSSHGLMGFSVRLWHCLPSSSDGVLLHLDHQRLLFYHIEGYHFSGFEASCTTYLLISLVCGSVSTPMKRGRMVILSGTLHLLVHKVHRSKILRGALLRMRENLLRAYPMCTVHKMVLWLLHLFSSQGISHQSSTHYKENVKYLQAN